MDEKISSYQNKLAKLSEIIKSEKEILDNLRMEYTRQRMKYCKAIELYQEIDYKLAEIDGRLKILPPYEPDKKKPRSISLINKIKTLTQSEKLALLVSLGVNKDAFNQLNGKKVL